MESSLNQLLNHFLIDWVEVLECRTITLFIPGKKYGEDTDQQVILPIQTSFWSFIDVDSTSKKHVQKDNTLLGQMVSNILSPGNKGPATIINTALFITAAMICNYW